MSFPPQRVFFSMILKFSLRIQIKSLNSVNGVVFVTKTCCVFCKVPMYCVCVYNLYIIQMKVNSYVFNCNFPSCILLLLATYLVTLFDVCVVLSCCFFIFLGSSRAHNFTRS